MRVLALGGAGGMGVHACRVVSELDGVSELVVSDLDEHRAAAVAAGCGPRATSRRLDVTDTRELRQALRDADVVLNTVGPFFRFGLPVLTAAIAAGCSYVDICDDPEPIPAMLDLDHQAGAAGVTALVGMGASPGLTNLLAVSAASELDHVDEIITGWSIEGAPPEPGPAGAPSAAVVHGIRQISGTIAVTRNGRVTTEPALRRVRIDYPGVGQRPGWTIGHPEAITLPRAFPAVSTSLNVAIGGRALMAGLKALRSAVNSRLLSERHAAVIVDRAERWLPNKLEHTLRPGSLPPLFAYVTGTHDGRPATVAAALAQLPGITMGEVTGIPLGVAVGLLSGRPPGVHTPETLLRPAEFFSALAPHCIGNPSPADMIVTTRSWDTDSQQALRTAMTRVRSLIPSKTGDRARA